MGIAADCKIEDCEKLARQRGMCPMHYRRWHLYGDPLFTKRTPPQPGRGCLVDDCGHPHEARGYCRTHYQRVVKHGSPDLPVREIPACTICGERAKARGYCEMHYIRWKKHGDPLNDGSRPLAERLAAGLVRTESGCLEWTGATLKGYGQIGDGRQVLYTHRVAFMLANGEIPDGMDVLHHCDNPPCCEPDHLFAGTALDNSTDMIAKGRGAWQRKPIAPRCGETIASDGDSRPCVRPAGHPGRHKGVIAHGANGYHAGCRCDLCCQGRKVCAQYAPEAGAA
jgi:HNH endonuclease